MAKRLLSIQKIVNLASDPATGTAGEIYYNTALNAYKYYNGTTWTIISSDAGVYVGITAPASPSEGDLWYNSETGKLLIYYDNFWVELSGGIGGSSLPDQTGNSGKFLTTNGTTPSWAIVDALPSQTGNSGKFLTTNGTAATWSTASPTVTLGGDLTGSATFTNLGDATLNATIAANSVELGVDTFGQYVAAISGTANQITVTGTGTETISATLSLPSSLVVPGTLTLNADPTQSLHAATKQYVDAVAEGLHIHASVGAATTENITNLSSPPATIDQVTLTNGMRVLVKNQTNNTQNGIYVYNSSTDALTRATDFNSSAEIQGGDFVFVTGGNLNDNTGWVQTETVTTVGTDSIIFQQFSGAGTYTAGTGLALNANQFSNTGVLSVNGSTGAVTGIAPLNSPTFTGTVTAPTLSLTTADTATAASHYFVETDSDGILRPKILANVIAEIVTTAAVNSAAATTVGTITSGTWNATNIALNRGGTNASLTAVNGGVVYSTASALAITSAGTAGQVLTSNGSSPPTWQNAAAGGGGVGFDAFLLAGM